MHLHKICSRSFLDLGGEKQVNRVKMNFVVNKKIGTDKVQWSRVFHWQAVLMKSGRWVKKHSPAPSDSRFFKLVKRSSIISIDPSFERKEF
jgi:hypothetical protein